MFIRTAGLLLALGAIASAQAPTPPPKPKVIAMPKKDVAAKPNPKPEPDANTDVYAVSMLAGKYKKRLNSAVGSRWAYILKDAKFSSLLSAGKTTVHFVVDARGKILRTKVTDNTSNSAHAKLCERAFIESERDIEPPPREVLRNGVFEDSFTFILY